MCDNSQLMKLLKEAGFKNFPLQIKKFLKDELLTNITSNKEISWNDLLLLCSSDAQDADKNRDISIFNLIINSVNFVPVESSGGEKLLNLMNQFIFENSHLECSFKFIAMDSINVFLADRDAFAISLLKFPSIIANKYGLKTPPSFLPKKFYSRILSVIMSTLTVIKERLESGLSSQFEYFARIIGKIAAQGHSDIVYNLITRILCENSADNFIWRKMGGKLMEVQSAKCLESLLRPLLYHSPDHDHVKRIMGDLPIRKSEIRYLMVKKFTTIVYFDKPCFIDNLISYLSAISNDLVIESIENLVDAWCNERALRTRYYAHHFYICIGLIFACKVIEVKKVDCQTWDAIMEKVTTGIEIYLKNAEIDFRLTGLYAGQVILALLEKGELHLDLDIAETTEVLKLKRLYEGGCIHDLSQVSEKREVQYGIQETGEVEKIQDHSRKCSDESNDPKPHINLNEERLATNKKPKYIVDCINGLLQGDNPDWRTACLENASELIRKNGPMVEDYAEDLARALLFLDDDFSTLNFERDRREAMISLTVACPISSANYLTKCFFDRNVVLRRRLDLLEVLAASSVEISRLTPSQSSLGSSKNPQDLFAEKWWERVVKERIKEKTKVFQSSSSPKLHINTFARVAPHFFYPLMKNDFNASVNLMADDYFLLARLLYTLGIVLDSTSQAFVSRKMGLALIEFLWTVRYHVERLVES